MIEKKDDDGPPSPEGGDSAPEDAAAPPVDPGAARRRVLETHMRTLLDLVMAHSYDLIWVHVVSEISDAGLSEQEIDGFIATFRQSLIDDGMSAAEIEEVTTEARGRLQKISACDPEEVGEIAAMATDESAPLILSTWINALNVAASRRGAAAWLRLSLLGDDMLPKGDKEAGAVFSAAFRDGSVTGAVARDILRKVRASLPPGKVIPDALASILDIAWDVVVVP